MRKFERGQFIIYEGRSAYVNFVSDQYITVCTHETLKPPEEAEHSLSPIRQVNVCELYILGSDFPQTLRDHTIGFPQSMRKLWKTLNKSRCVFYLSEMFSGDAPLARFPTKVKSLRTISETLDNNSEVML